MSTDPSEMTDAELEAMTDAEVDATIAQMEAEDAELELESDDDDTQPDDSPAERPSSAAGSPPIPPASFTTLVEMFTTQSMMAMGLIPHPTSGKPEPQLPLARHFIDLLGILDGKTAGNLSADENSFLGGSLHFLRMSFVEISKKPGRSE